MSSAYRKGLLVILALATAAAASADLPVVGDSFATGGGRSSSAPLDGMPTQRGHRVWQASAGVTLEEGGLVTSSPGEVAGLRFSFLDHPYAARGVIDTVLDPGDAGWVGVGFADTARTPLPQSGQVWVELSANGKLTVRANGSRHRLHQDAHAHPAFVDGPNRIRLQYDRATNSVRLWLNRVEVALDEPDLDVFGFTPDIRLAGFQGHFRQRDQKAAGAVIQTFNVNLGEEDLGDTFTLGGVRGLVNGTFLDGVPIETGGVTWSATGSTVLGNNFITNFQNATDPKAGVPFNPAEHPGYRAAAVEAVADVAGAGGWFGLGFTNAPAGSLWSSGLAWVLIQSDGRVKVNVEGTAHNLYNALLNPTLPAHVKLEYDRVNNSVRAWVNGQELALTSNLVDHQYTPAITHASFHRFTSTQPFPTSGLFHLDDFAVTLTPIEPLGFVVGPTGVTVPEHDAAEMTCAATGGFPPYSYHWERNRWGCMVLPQKAASGWTDVADGNGVSGSQTDTLRFDPVDLAHESCYRCVVTDSNTIPSTLASGSANLNVRETIARDEFANYTTPPPTELLNTRVTPIGGLTWSSRSGLQILNDQVTNLVASQTGGQVAGLPIDPTWVAGYRTLAVEAEVEIPLSSGWMGLGFSRSGSATDYRFDGQIYVRIDANGRASVLANGQAHTLYQGPTPDPSFRSGQLNHLKVQYDTETHVVKTWLNGSELPLTTPDLDTVGFTPNLAFAGMNVFRNFSGAEQWHGRSFTVSVDSVVPPPVFTVQPQTTYSGLGYSPTFTCAASGGVGDLSVQWQRKLCDPESGVCDPEWAVLDRTHSVGIVTDSGEGAVSSTLTLRGADKSDEGYVRCVVTDSAIEPRVVESGQALLQVSYPDFEILVDRDFGSTIELYQDNGNVLEPANYLWVGNNYVMTMAVHWETAELAPGLDVPVSVWARCHDPEPSEPFGDVTWYRLGSTWMPSSEPGIVEVPVSPSVDCLQGADWRMLSLQVDVNGDPSAGSPAACFGNIGGYPCYMGDDDLVVPERGAGGNNQKSLPQWTLMGSRALDQVVGAPIKLLDFKSSSDLPEAGSYPEVWVATTFDAGGNGTFRFNMSGSATIPDGSCPSTPCDPELWSYYPYFAWDSDTTLDPEAVIIRYRHTDAGSSDMFFLGGFTNGAPPPVSGSNPLTTAARLRSYFEDRALVVGSTHVYNQYRTVVMRPGEPVQNDPHPDWLASLNEDLAFGPGADLSIGGGFDRFYLAFTKWCAGYGCSDGYPTFHLDFIGLWGAPGGGATGWDARPSNLLVRSPSGAFSEFQGPVDVGTSQQLCVGVTVDPPDHQPPVNLYLGITAPGQSDATVYPVGDPLQVSSGLYAFCMEDASHQPAYWQPAEPGEHDVLGVILWGSEQDDYPANDGRYFAAHAVETPSTASGARLVFLPPNKSASSISDWVLKAPGVDETNLNTLYHLGALIPLPSGAPLDSDRVTIQRLDYDLDGDPVVDQQTGQPIWTTLSQAQVASGQYFYLSRSPQTDDTVYGVFEIQGEAGQKTDNWSWTAAGRMGSTFIIRTFDEQGFLESETRRDLVNMKSYMQGDPDATTNDALEETRGYQPTSLAVSDLETVDGASGNLVVRIPLTTVRTDGGLAYDVALTYNSKVWAEHYVPSCKDAFTENPPVGGDEYPEHVPDILDRGYRLFYTARGVEGYGLGWEMRPPRVISDERYTFGYEEATDITKLRAFVDTSGAEHLLFSEPLNTADQCSSSTCMCMIMGEYAVDSCYTWDGSNLKLSVERENGTVVSVLVESPDGTEYELAQKVVPSKRGYIANDSVDPYSLGCTGFSYSIDYREDVAGFYATEIRRGPWVGGVAQNGLRFTYCSEDGVESCNADGDPWLDEQQTWLVKQIEELGPTGVPTIPPTRAVTFSYEDLVPSSDPSRPILALTSVEAPAFDGDVATWSLGYDVRSSSSGYEPPPPLNLNPGFDRPVKINPEWGTEATQGAFLTGVTLPTGEEYHFEYGAESRLTDLWLPTDSESYLGSYPVDGGTIHYDYGTFKSDRVDCHTPDPEVPEGCAIGHSYTIRDCSTLSTIIDASNVGVVTRRRGSTDASGALSTTTTTFDQYRACNPDRWPYRDDDFEAIASAEMPGTGYLWTWIETSGPVQGGSPTTARQAEVHRYHLRTRREFSRDQIALIPTSEASPATVFPIVPDNNSGMEESWGLPGVRRLSHQRTAWERLTEVQAHIYYDDRLDQSRVLGQGLYPAREEVWTNPGSLTDPNLGDDGIQTCAQSQSCMKVVTTSSVDEFLQVQWRRVRSLGAPVDGGVDLNVDRGWKYNYFPVIPENSLPDPWRFGMLDREGVCEPPEMPDPEKAEDGGCTEAVWPTKPDPNWKLLSRTWSNQSSGTGAKVFYLPTEVNLGRVTSCVDSSDCFGHTLHYDTWGNLTSDTVIGGYKADGNLGVTELTTNYEYTFGRPSRKYLTSRERETLALWEREIDPNTRLVRSQLDGSGVGSAYSYDVGGRITDIVPVMGPTGSPQVPPSNTGGRLRGVHVDYWLPDSPSNSYRAEHRVFDLVCWNGDPRDCERGEQLRGSTAYDQLGQTIRTTEFIPGSDGSPDLRSRFVRRRWSDDGRVEAVSEWARGTDYSSTGLFWTTTTFGDGLGRATRVENPDSQLSWMSDDFVTSYAGGLFTLSQRNINAEEPSEGRIVSDLQVTDPFERTRRSIEDVWAAEAIVAGYEYDVADRVTEVDVAGQIRTFGYSPGGFLLETVEPERKVTGMTYDAVGNILTRSIGNNATSYGYDSFGRPVGTYVDKILASRLKYGTSGAAYNRVETAEQVAMNSDVTVLDTWTYSGPTHQVSARMTTLSGDVNGAYSVSYGYDEWGNLAAVTSPTLVSMTSGYDGAWLIDVDLGLSQDFATLKYHPNGRTAELKLNSGALTVTEVADDHGMARPKSISAVFPSEPGSWSTGDYVYDHSGNIVGVGTKSFEYDGVNRLIGFDDTSFEPDIEMTYSYDDYGNLTSFAAADAGTNRLSDANYDARGNLIGGIAGAPASMVYSGEDRLLEADGWEYAYDAAGERIAAWDGNTTIVSVRDEGGRVLTEYKNGVPTDYLYAGGQLVGTTSGGAMKLFAKDHLGSTRLVVGGDGQFLEEIDYHPFGEFLPGLDGTETDRLFTDHERDLATGLDYMHARYYSSDLGRFLSVDPVGGTVGSSQSWNRYSYVRNNPLGFSDPNGEDIIAQVHRVAGNNFHISLRIEPNDQSRATGHPFDQTNPSSGKRYATLGAGPSRGTVGTLAGLSSLVSAPNRDRDVDLKGNPKVEEHVLDLGGRDENEVIDALFSADSNYGDDLDYELFPESDDQSYNSNSYVSGILLAVGIAPPEIDANVPGYDKPVPSQMFSTAAPSSEESDQ